MPYWRRPTILEASLATYRKFYREFDVEVVVVDDGSPDGVEIRQRIGPSNLIYTFRLPSKESALNPCIPFNRGAEYACGDILVLTNPEVIPRAPIIAQMQDELEKLGPRGYVAAACWSPSAKWWYCHSTLMPPDAQVGRAPTPKGAGLHFCSMIHREFYNEVGGFSEEYRDGQGYEDNDFLWKLHRAGARFKICDDLVTDHHDCPRAEWPPGGHERNRKIFEQKWPHVGSAT